MKEKGNANWKMKLESNWNKANKVLNEIYLGEETYTRITGKFINAVKVFIVSSRKFILDDCFTKASSIAYTTIISLIPTLTVALTFYSIFSGVGDKKEELFRRITLFMLEHNIKLNIDPIFEAVSSLVENAGKIGGVGAVVLVFSATAVLRTLEKSLDDIWRIKTSRAISLKVIFYWAALTLGPLMIIAATTVATQISTVFSSPNYRAAHITQDNNLWVVGNKAQILYSAKASLRFYTVPHEKIDFDNQRVFEYDNASKSFRELEFKVEEFEFNKSEFRDIQFIGNNGWVVGKDGILMFTYDRGRTWHLEKWGGFNFTDIHMLDLRRGFITAENGYLLSTDNGGKSWQTIEWVDLTSNLNSITFFDKQGIIACDRGMVLLTADAGRTWKLLSVNEAKRKKRPVNLHAAYFLDGDSLWLVGDEGVMLTSDNGGKSWKNHKFLEGTYNTAYFIDKSHGYIAGDKGVLISTSDGGMKWTKKEFASPRINRIYFSHGTLWAFGDTGLIMTSKDQGKTWKGVVGKSFVVFLLNFFAPFIFIWLLFLLTYIGLPNTKVPFKPAAIGAAFTGTIWVAFILLFIVYIKAFAQGTFAIYGALAAFPIFLLMVYTSALIILYGAEVSYTLMYPQSYRNLKKALKEEAREVNVFYGVSLLYHIYKRFEAGKGPTTLKDIVKLTSNKVDEVEHFMTLFKKDNLVIETEQKDYIPAKSSKNINLADVLDLIHDVSLDIPGHIPSADPLKKYIGRLFAEMGKSRKGIIGKTTLNDIIEELG